MKIIIEETNGSNLTLVVDGMSQINCALTIEGELDPGQAFKRATMQDPFGQEGFPASFTIYAVGIQVTDEWMQSIPESAVIDELKHEGFFEKVIEAVNEAARD